MSHIAPAHRALPPLVLLHEALPDGDAGQHTAEPQGPPLSLPVPPISVGVSAARGALYFSLGGHVLLVLVAVLFSVYAVRIASLEGGSDGPLHGGDVLTVSLVATGFPVARPVTPLAADGAPSSMQESTTQNSAQQNPPPEAQDAAIPISDRKTPQKPSPKKRSEKKASPTATPRTQKTPPAISTTAAPADAHSGTAGNSLNTAAVKTGNTADTINTAGGQGRSSGVVWNGDGGPRFKRQAPLRYPPMALRRQQEGKALVEVHLDATGQLQRATVVHADHVDFGKAALACVQASLFVPAQVEGRGVACVVRIPMHFVLRSS